MKKILKMLQGSPFNILDINGQKATFTKQVPTDLSGIPQIKNLPQTLVGQSSTTFLNGISALSGLIFNQGVNSFTNNIFGDTGQVGQAVGGIFGNAFSTAGQGALNNLIKGQALSKDLAMDVGQSVSGAAAGLAGTLIGNGVTSAMGDSRLGRAVGAGTASAIGQVGGQVVSGLAKGVKAGDTLAKLGNSTNIIGIGGQVLGSALGAATGPSKEYGGKYGNITLTMDSVYDIAQAGAAFIPGVGTAVSGIMALNKGLSNIFGSTDGMCVCAGTKVFTASGDIVNIEDLVLEQGIIGWSEKTHEIRPLTIKGFVEPKLKECLEIELKSGHILRCSIDHPILSHTKEKAESHRINGKRIAYRNWKFHRADELKVGNWVGLANNIDYWGEEEMSNAYLVGMLIGDGSYTYESSCRLISADPDTWEYLESNNLGIINHCDDSRPEKYQKEIRTYRIIDGMQLVKDLGIAYQKGKEKTLPKNLGKYNRDSICKMIAGLYDTDGSISVNEEKKQFSITFYLSNLELLKDLKLILQKLGIFSTINKRKASVNKLKNGKIINSNESYRLEIGERRSVINFYKNIPLNISYKKENLEKIYQLVLPKRDQDHCELSGAKQSKIISIKSIGVQTVYNLEALEDHTYIANGIITHNTKTDAILGSAFMPAPIKWLNMWGSSKTGTFNNLSWLNTLKANDFMGNAFGNLNDKFDKAREEAGKTYGTFSQGAKRRALENIDFANRAWGLVMDMADQNELLNIRSLYMSSINNQRYALNIQGGFTPLARGKQGMKIFNNSINHSVGMRLLSGAALIDDKQMILSKCSELN